MVIFLKKAVRSMLENKKSYISCVAIIAVGIMFYSSFNIASITMNKAASSYYTSTNFADVFAQVKSIPKSAVDSLRGVSGVSDVQGRYVLDLRVIVPDTSKLVTLRVTSVDTGLQGELINQFNYKGSYFTGRDEIMLSSDFMTQHKLKPGDSVTLISNGRELSVPVCASVDSPEYVYAVRNVNELVPDPTTFGYAYMAEPNFFRLTGDNGFYNDIVYKLDNGVVYDDVKTAISDSLGRYELLSLYPRKDQASYNILKLKIDQLVSYSTSIPSVFIIVSVIILYLMLKRLIEQDRTQIGTLKAFGFKDRTILWHYMSYGVVTGFLGGICGSVLGLGEAYGIISVYQVYFKLPSVTVIIPPEYIVAGVGISVVSGAVGAFLGSRRVLDMSPAAAMRPPSPEIVRFDILKHLGFFTLALNSAGKMAIRSISRNKVRSLVVALGIMISFGLMVLIASMSSMFGGLLTNQYTKIQAFDAKVTFSAPQPTDAGVQSVRRLAGVSLAEGILEIPVQLKYVNKSAGTVITGIEAGSSLYRIYSNDERRYYAPPTDGIIVSDILASKLGARKNSVLYLSSPLLSDDIKIVVTDVAYTNIGASAYMDADALARLFGMNKAATSVIIRCADVKSVQDSLTDAKNVSFIEDEHAMLLNYKDMMGVYSALIYMMEIFGALFAFAIIYNTAVISLSERKREFSTLRVLGMQARQVAGIMSFEYWVLTAVGIILGVPCGYWLKLAIAQSLSGQMFSLPMYTPPDAYAVALCVCVATVIFANRSSGRNIKKLDLVEVLKERD